MTFPTPTAIERLPVFGYASQMPLLFSNPLLHHVAGEECGALWSHCGLRLTHTKQHPEEHDVECLTCMNNSARPKPDVGDAAATQIGE